MVKDWKLLQYKIILYLCSLYIIKEKKYGEELDSSNIFNMDESPIYLKSIIKKTVAPIAIGAKSINIRTYSGEKTEIIMILLISPDWEKFPPLF